jgi:hypothetical protein
MDADGVDPADLWVLDPRTGEYRMRLPGEAPPAAARPRPAAPAASSGASGASGPATPAASASTAEDGRAARRRGPQHSGPWVAAMGCFLLLVGGTGGYLLLRSSNSNAAEQKAAQGTGGQNGAPAPSASCSVQPSAGAPTGEPPVSGAFLKGSKASAIDVRVTVLNGSGSFGQAEAVLSWMQNTEHYLRSSNGGPAPATVPRTTLVYAPNHVDQARTLAAAMGLPEGSLHGDGKTTTSTGRMVLTLGQDFHGIGKPFAAPSPAATAGAQSPAGCGSQ